MQRRLAYALSLGSALVFSNPANAVPRFDYIVGIGLERNDNVNLSEDNAVSSSIVRPWFGFRLREEGSSVQAFADGLIEYRDYSNGDFSNETRSALNAQLNWQLLPERLELVFVDHLAEAPINSLAPNTPINLQRTNVFGVGPNLHFKLDDTLRTQVELRYIDSEAEITDDFDSRRSAAALRLIKDLNPLTQISGHVQADRIRFKNDSSIPDYERYEAYARFARKLRVLDLGVDLGYSWLDGSEPIGSRSKPLARLRTLWSVNSSNSLSLRVAHQFSDTSTDMLEGVQLAAAGSRRGPLPTSLVVDANVINAAPYLEDRFELAYAWQGATMSWGVAPHYRRFDYLDSLIASADLDQSAHGASAFFNWQVRPNLTFGATAGTDRIRYSDLDRTDRDTNLGMYLLHRWARHWSWRADLSHLRRSSDAAGQTYKQNIVFVSLAYTR